MPAPTHSKPIPAYSHLIHPFERDARTLLAQGHQASFLGRLWIWIWFTQYSSHYSVLALTCNGLEVISL